MSRTNFQAPSLLLTAIKQSNYYNTVVATLWTNCFPKYKTKVLFICNHLCSQYLFCCSRCCLIPAVVFSFSVRKHQYLVRWRLAPWDGPRLRYPTHTCHCSTSASVLPRTHHHCLGETELCFGEG